MKNKGPYFFLPWFKQSRYFSFIFIQFIPLNPCPHPCPCPCSGSFYNQMFWTHDFDHMSLIYDIVTTFCLAHNEESQAIFLFQPFQLFVIIMCSLCYCWILPLCPSLILAPDRHCLLPARCHIFPTATPFQVPETYRLQTQQDRSMEWALRVPQPQQIESRQNKKRCASLRTSQTCIPKKPEPGR